MTYPKRTVVVAYQCGHRRTQIWDDDGTIVYWLMALREEDCPECRESGKEQTSE